MLAGLVVADDLTGACDTGHEFATRGYHTRVTREPASSPTDADVLVVDTDSRYAPTEAAADAVRAAVESYPAETLYKKVDSTLRGNLAAEVEAALRALLDRQGRDGQPGGSKADGLALVAPATPATGRTTACGIHLVEGELVTDTEPGRDPDKGPPSPRLPALFDDVDLPVEHLEIQTVAAGPEAVADRLHSPGSGPRIVTADATHERHLRAVAAGVDRLDEPAVYVGSAGLAGHVPVAVPSAGPEEGVTPAAPDDRAGVLGVAGSVAPQTLAALEAIPRGMLAVLDVEAAVADPEGTVAEATRRVRDVLTAEGRAVVTAASDDAAVDRALEAGRQAGLADRETRDRVADALARTAGGVVDVADPAGLFLTGGDTAATVLETIDADAIVLSGEAVENGIPLGTVEGGSADGAALVTKAGAFGDRETVINCLDRLQDV
jgi:uncharacterized protein YgbK (DUF1537 family)